MKITLKAARVSKGLTQKDAAKLIGITVETLANYEKGKTYPDIPILKKIEDTYDVRYNQLIFLPENNALSKVLNNNVAVVIENNEERPVKG